jgi:hypothetical protein
MLASIIGHEFGHLIKEHSSVKRSRINELGAAASRRARQTYNATWNLEAARNVYARQLLNARIEYFAFSREIEKEADDYGIQMASKAGYKPDGAIRLAIRYISRGYAKDVGLFDSHPGFWDRVASADLRVTDETFDQAATSFRSKAHWGELNSHVAQWLERLPESGNAWYYKSILLKHRGKLNGAASLENAFLMSKPTLSKLVSEYDEAWLLMCLALYGEGYRFESANCAREIRDAGLMNVFLDKTGQRDRLFVGGGVYGALSVRFFKSGSGEKVIRNDVDLATSDGAATSPDTPSWKAVRYQVQRKAEPQQGFSWGALGEHSDEQIGQLQTGCRPPLCRVVR